MGSFLSLRSVLFTVLLTGFTITGLRAQTKFVNEFLNIGVGARAHGMFGSVVASVDDVTAAYWNPAGLVQMTAPAQLSAMHANWFGGIANYDYGALGRKSNQGRSAMAFSFIRMGIDDIPNTLNLVGPDGSVDPSRVTGFSAADYAFMGSYATKLGQSDKLSVGGTVKVIRRTIGSFGGAWGFGADLGLQYRTGNLRWALMARDITTTFNTWSFNLTDEEQAVFLQTGNDVPISSTELALPRLVFGVNYTKAIKRFSVSSELNLTASSDGRASGLISSRSFAIDPTLGFEVGYNKLLYLRFGLGNIQRVINSPNSEEAAFEIQPNMGMGIRLGRIHLDYALTNIGSVSGVLVSNIFSLKFDFADKKSNAAAEEVIEEF